MLGAVAAATMLGVLPAVTAVAQPQAPGQNPALALAAQQRLSLAAVHLVTGTVRDAAGHAVSGACVLVTGADGHVRMARTSGSGRYEMSLPRAGAYSVQYRDCQPGQASGPAFAPASAHQIQLGAGPLTTLPARDGPTGFANQRPRSASRRPVLPRRGRAGSSGPDPGPRCAGPELPDRRTPVPSPDG